MSGLATAEVGGFYGALGVDVPDRPGNVPVHCIAADHEDRNASASLHTDTGAWNCHACGAGGGPYEAAIALGHDKRDAAELCKRYGLWEDRESDLVRQSGGATPRRAPKPAPDPLPTEEELNAAHARLLSHPGVLARLLELRGLTTSTIEHFRLGLEADRVVIPVRGSDSRLVSVLRYKPPGKRADNERKLLAPKGRQRSLFPAPESLAGETLWLVEGEPDVLAGHELGLATVGIPGAEYGKRADKWAHHFAGRKVNILLDCDEPGRDAAQRIAKALAVHAAEVRVIDIEVGRSDGHDLTDLLLEGIAASNGDGRRQVRVLLERAAELAPLIALAPEQDTSAPVEAAASEGTESSGKDDKQRKPGQALTFADGDPWPEPVDGASLAGEIHAAVQRHVVLPPEAAVAVTLWALFTHVHDSSRVSPLLAITSPAKRCGKTTLFSVVKRLVPRAVPSSNITAAALFRVIENAKPTLLIDEADSFLAEREELRGILNSGHTADAAFVLRVVGDGANADVRQFSTWAPKVFAGIGSLPDTLTDRSVVIRMERKTLGESAEPLRAGDERYLDLLAKAKRWALDHPTAAGRSPDLPSFLNDRAADNWRPLVSVAETLGGEWPELAGGAAAKLSPAEEADDGSVSTQLLADLRELFEEKEVLWTEDVLENLTAREDRPWAEWRRGGPLTAQGLSRLLKPFGVKPRDIKIAGEVRKGYRREQFGEPWKRYLPAGPTALPATPLLPAPDAGLRDFVGATPLGEVADRDPADFALRLRSSGVAATQPGTPERGETDGRPATFEDLPPEDAERAEWAAIEKAHGKPDEDAEIERIIAKGLAPGEKAA